MWPLFRVELKEAKDDRLFLTLEIDPLISTRKVWNWIFEHTFSSYPSIHSSQGLAFSQRSNLVDELPMLVGAVTQY